MPTKLPSNIPNFEGKLGEDPSNHMISFNLWCSSNSITEEFVRICLFQITLMGATAKWYIDQPRNIHRAFKSIVKVFLSFFQFPIFHDLGIEILTTCAQTTTTHISIHIHEWHIWRVVCKSNLNDIFLKDYFQKSLLPPISKDVAMTLPQNEEEAILKSHEYDLIYT
jgi:hypothetical protein